MPDHDLATLARSARRARRLPPSAACESCGTTAHLAARPDGRVLCYACLQRENGHRGFEEDHIAGRNYLGGLVAQLYPNAHRDVTDLRTQIGKDDWPTAKGDPLLILAHLMGGLGTLLIVIARWLLELAEHAAEHLGPSGWTGAAPSPVIL